MPEEDRDDEIGGSDMIDLIFASAKYYFPILICTRKEEPKKPGEGSSMRHKRCVSYLLIVF